MEINPEADTPGLNPNTMEGPMTATIISGPEGDPVQVRKRELKDGKGSFQQYSLFLETAGGAKARPQYLFERQLAPLAKAYGPDSKKWVGKEIKVGSEPDPNNNTYRRLFFEPLEV